MNWSLAYKLLLGVGGIAITTSFFFEPQLFFSLMSIGALCAGFALFELWDIKRGLRMKTPPPVTSAASSTTNTAPIAKTISSSPPPSKSSFSSKIAALFHKKTPPLPEEVHVAAIKGLPQQKQKKIAAPKKQDIAVIEEPGQKDINLDHKVTLLKKFIRESLKQGFAPEKIREAALQSHWPKDLFDKTFEEATHGGKKKKLVIGASTFLLMLVYITILHFTGKFLLPYWIASMRHASPLFYVGVSFIAIAVITLFLFRLRKVFKKKKVISSIEEEEHVMEIKTQLQTFAGRYETDLDKLYALLAERKMLKVNEVAKAFNIPKMTAEEWGKILKEQNLAEIYYPAVGDMEIRWKKLKSMPSL